MMCERCGQDAPLNVPHPCLPAFQWSPQAVSSFLQVAIRPNGKGGTTLAVADGLDAAMLIDGERAFRTQLDLYLYGVGTQCEKVGRVLTVQDHTTGDTFGIPVTAELLFRLIAPRRNQPDPMPRQLPGKTILGEDDQNV